MQVQLILILGFALFVSVFALQNTMPVVIKFLFWEANLSLVLVVLGAVAIGALISFLISTLKQFGIIRERKELHRQIAALTKEKEEWTKTVSESKEPQSISEATTIEELDRVMGSADDPE